MCKLNDGRLSQKQVETSGSVQFEQLNWGRNLTDSCQKSALYAFAALKMANERAAKTVPPKSCYSGVSRLPSEP